ncbi:MAG: hypothetical protein ACRC0V_05160 [Fusobacteriaceae bacterium]
MEKLEFLTTKKVGAGHYEVTFQKKGQRDYVTFLERDMQILEDIQELVREIRHGFGHKSYLTHFETLEEVVEYVLSKE